MEVLVLKRLWYGAATLIVAVALTALAIPRSDAATAVRREAPPDRERAVTLITGDRVFVRGGADGVPQLRLMPGRGRERAGFLRYVSREHAYVLPTDAAPLVAAGRLDRRLFDVTGLLRQGYDDERYEELPLLARYANRASLSARTANPTGARVTKTYGHVPIAALREDKRQAGAFWQSTVSVDGRTGAPTLRSGVDTIWLDGKAALALAESVPHIGAPSAWQRGLTGAGVSVAVLDTGVDLTHPDLAGAVAASVNFTNDPAGVIDTIGHGTHVASIVAGRGTASGGRYTGVAPGAGLLIGKVCADTEQSESGPCPESAILAGMEWAASSGARVVNLSLGGAPTDGTDPLSAVVNALTDRYGTLFVASAGNHAPWLPGDRLVSTPAAADAALAVANLTKDDQLSDTSNLGPRVGDFALKPDLAAPGVDIVAARAAQGYLGDPVDDHYTSLTGTSMASPHVAGAAAILAQQHPTWRAADLKAALLSTATAVADVPVYGRGAGLVDVARATGQPAWASPGSLSLAYFRWPNATTPPVSRTVTYHNDGDAPLDLDLRLSMADASGAPAPAGMFTMDASAVTVPAHGTALVTITAAPVAGRAGLYGGELLAASGSTIVRTALGLYQEPESYNLAVRTIDRTGASPTNALAPTILVVNLDTGDVQQPSVVDGRLTERLPVGRYAVWAGIATEQTTVDKRSLTLAFEPEIHLTRDVALTFDARAGQPVRQVVDRADARANSVDTFGVFQTAGGQTQYASGSVFNARQFVIPTRTSAPGFGFFHTVTMLAPEIRLDVVRPDRFPVPVDYVDVSYAPRLLGDVTLTAVDGGKGTPADLATVDVKSRLVLLTLNNPGETDALSDIVARIASAGGRAVLLTTPHPADRVDGSLALPTMVTDSGPGQRLLRAVRAGKTTVRLRGSSGSPYQYNLVLTRMGAMPADLTFRVRDRDLARVRTTYAAQGVDTAVGTTHTTPSGVFGWTSPVKFGLPATRDEFFSTGTSPGTTDPLRWSTELRNEGSWDFSKPYGAWQAGVRGPYQPGNFAERYNVGPFGPCLNRFPLRWLENLLIVQLPRFCPSGSFADVGPLTFFGEESGSTVVRRDGVEIGRSEEPGQGFFETPSAPGSYEVIVDLSRTAPWTSLNTRQHTAWSFAWTALDEPAPVLAVRFATPLDDHNRAPAGSHTLTVSVDRTAAAGEVSALTVEVSYDDGRTWTALRLDRGGSAWTAAIRPPRGAAYVSLRATARDAAGNSVTHEVIHAYGIR